MRESMFKNRKSLRWSMIRMLLFGWFFPLVMLILIMIFLVSARINKQVQNTIETSAEKAAEILGMQIDDCVVASKNASYMPVIRDAYRAYEEDGNRRDFHEAVSVFLEQQYKFNSNFKDAIMIFPGVEEKIFHTINNSKGGIYNDIQVFEKYAKKLVLEESEMLDTGVKLMNINNRIYLIRNIKDSKFRTYAMLILELDQNSFMESMESIWGYEDAQIYADGELLFDSNKTTDLLEEGNISLNTLTHGNTLYKKGAVHSYICRQTKQQVGKLTFVVKLDNQVTNAQMWVVRYIFVIVAIFMIPLAGQLLHFFHKKVTMPVKEMVTAAEALEVGKFGTQIEKLADSEEFYYMEEAFNHMSLQLKNQFEKIYLEEIALRDARIMALQSQINPHFLNNTLEIINWEARLNENYKVSGMIEALSTMLEATTNRKAQSFITIGEEMAYVDAYLYIIAQRFGEKFQCTKEIDDELFDVKVPRLIIQPIVENAVEHGMDISRQGIVVIRILRDGEKYLKIEVEDNGTLTEEEREKIDRLLWEEPDPENEKRISLGIRNVDQRLKIIYGAECGLFIISNKENHTVSTLLIKINNQSEQ